MEQGAEIYLEYPPKQEYRMGQRDSEYTFCLPVAIDLLDAIDDNSDALIFEVNGFRVLRLPLSILALTGRKTGTIQSFDFSAFFPKMDLYHMSNSYCIIKLESNRPFSLHVRNFNIDVSHQEFIEDHPIQQIAEWSWTSDVPKYSITASIGFDNLSKGYIIEASDITQLSRFNLRLNNIDQFNYNPELLATFTHQLSPQHLWIPANQSLPSTPFHRMFGSFDGGINQSLIDNLSFHLEFFEPQTSVTIYSITLNKFKVLSETGYGGAIQGHHHILPPYRYVTPLPPENRPFPASRAMDLCPITFEPFNSGDIYGECLQCHHCFHDAALQQAFSVIDTRYAIKTCPVCRIPWPNTLQLYRVPAPIT